MTADTSSRIVDSKFKALWYCSLYQSEFNAAVPRFAQDSPVPFNAEFSCAVHTPVKKIRPAAR